MIDRQEVIESLDVTFDNTKLPAVTGDSKE